MGPIWQAQLEESLVMLIGPAGNPIYCPIGHQIWGPLGKQDVCPNFALTAAKFVFSNSGNFRATLGQRQIRQSPRLALNAHSGNDWGPIPVLTGKSLSKQLLAPNLPRLILQTPDETPTTVMTIVNSVKLLDGMTIVTYPLDLHGMEMKMITNSKPPKRNVGFYFSIVGIFRLV